MIKKKPYILCIFLIASLLLSSCGEVPAEPKGLSSTAEITAAEPMTIINPDMFSKRDLDATFSEKNSAAIKLSGDSAECDYEGVKINGGNITISSGGTYIVSGRLDDGSIIVDAQDTDKIQLVLSGAEISSKNYAAIYVKQADKVFVTLADGTANYLSNGGTFSQKDDNNVDAAVFSKDDLTFNGSGKLTVDSPAGHAVVCNDELTVAGGSYVIHSGAQGLKAKDGILICASQFEMKTGKDGIHAESGKEEAGLVYIDSGIFSIEADGDGISASGTLTASSGSFDISCLDDSSSAKGLKATGNIDISGGAFSIASADDGIHSNSDITISGGSMNISSGDDGVHADNSVSISGGNICISKSYEGIEGKTVEIDGGEIRITASDDGLNAAGGVDGSGFGGPEGPDKFSDGTDCHVHITGGSVYLNTDGDGIDSNGSLEVSGGVLFISGPTDRDNSAIDFESKGVITGGTVAAAGAAQMAVNFSEQSTQCSVLVDTGMQKGGSVIELKDSSGNEIINYIPEKDYECVLISSPELAVGQSYVLKAGDHEEAILIDAVISGMTSGMGGMMPGHVMPGEMPPGKPGDIPPGGFDGKPPERPERK